MRDVTEHIMGQKLSDVHNSVEDAKASLQAATYVFRAIRVIRAISGYISVISIVGSYTSLSVY